MLKNKNDFEFSDVYHANQQAKEDIIINQGGTDSGKTYAIMQLFFMIAISVRPPDEDPIITIVAESVPNLKKGAYRKAKDMVNAYPFLHNYILNWNETDRTIYFKSGWVMEFNSYVTEQQAKQGKRQYLFCNEAQSIEWLVFWQLAKRTRQRTFIDYNPTISFWAHEKLIGTNPDTNELSATVRLIISDHRHNSFLSDEDHRKTEGIKDPQLWNVYARGLTGNLTGLIFPEWTMIADELFPKDCVEFAGLDFGYTHDPTAGIKIAKLGESLFLHELCYTPGISPTQMKSIFDANGLGSKPIFCEHDEDNILQLRRLGLTALPARKGAGSINAGIIKLKEYKVFYTASSKNLHIEKSKYMWLVNPDTGKPTNTPIDKFNHLMDATRYGVYTQSYK